jgi:tRNA(Ile)-lysidine synthase TilS/MesJ
MQCSKCHRDSICFQSYSGLHLCARHLAADVETKAKKMIRAHRWLKCGDHIAVALSGDKSSTALLYFFKKLTAERRDIRISAITMDDRNTGIDFSSPAKRMAELLDAECFALSLPEGEPDVVDTVAQETGETTACFNCHPQNVILPERVAHQHGITKIALGISLDDAAAAVLESVIRGDVERLGSRSCPETIPRISPFISVTAAEVSLYADISGLGDEYPVCPGQADGLHKDLIAMLERFTNNHPSTKYALLNLGEELAGSPSGIEGLIRACERYGRYRQWYCNGSSTQGGVTNGAN